MRKVRTPVGPPPGGNRSMAVGNAHPSVLSEAGEVSQKQDIGGPSSSKVKREKPCPVQGRIPDKHREGEEPLMIVMATWQPDI